MANLEETRAWASTFFADLRFNGKNGALPYRLHLPGRYERGKTYPLVLLMHGYGSIGSDNWGPLFFCGLFAGFWLRNVPPTGRGLKSRTMTNGWA